MKIETKSLTNLILEPLMVGGFVVSLMLMPAAFAKPKLSKEEQKQNQQTTGPIAGGGGFICTTSERVLDNAKSQLANQIRTAPAIVFSTLPQGWTRERIVHIVETVRLEDEKPATFRHGKKLRFDYGQDQNGDYIEALEPFCYTYEGTPVDSADKDMLQPIYRQIHIEIMHEIAHLMNIGQSKETDSQARKFATEFLGKVLNSFMLCEFKNLTEEQKQLTMPQTPSGLNSDKIIIANVAGKRLQFLDMILPENISIERLGNDPDHLLKKGLHSYFSTKMRRKQYVDLAASSTSQYVQQLPIGNILTIEVWGDLQSTQPYSAYLTFENLGLTKWSVNGACKVLALPIEFNFEVGGPK